MTTGTPARAPRANRFDPASFEQKWRDRWEAEGLYTARDDDPRPKRYILTMYPYPSGELHIGHWYAATGPDIVARAGSASTRRPTRRSGAHGGRPTSCTSPATTTRARSATC